MDASTANDALNIGVDENCVVAPNPRSCYSTVSITEEVKELFREVAAHNCGSRNSSDVAISQTATSRTCNEHHLNWIVAAMLAEKNVVHLSPLTQACMAFAT